MPQMCCFLTWRVLPLGLGSAHILPGHSLISPAPVQVATPLLGSPAQGEEMTLVPRPSWLCQYPHPAPAIPHLSTEAVALILVDKPRDRAQGSWLGLTSVVESDDAVLVQGGQPRGRVRLFSFSEVPSAHFVNLHEGSRPVEGACLAL